MDSLWAALAIVLMASGPAATESAAKTEVPTDATVFRERVRQFLAGFERGAQRLGADGRGVKIFFLSCVLIAGLYGAATASRKILFVQALPAAIALALLVLAR